VSAAAALLIAIAPLAAAQTVIVKNAAPNAPTELLLNADTVATAAADSQGTATLATDILARLQRAETGVHVSVDTCGQQKRVLLVENGVQAAAQGSCRRGTVRDLFSLQRITTLVVDVSGENPIVWIRQGPAPIEWVGDIAAAEHRRSWAAPPVGIILSGGLGAASFSDAVAKACGDAATCSGGSFRSQASAGATFWVTRFLGAEVGYLRPGRVTATGTGTSVTFDSQLDARALTIDGKLGGQAGPVRIYGLGGVNRLSATSTTLQTVTTSAVGAETFAFRAEGWGWLAGGGMELWMLRRVGIYLEGDLLALKGTGIDNGQGSINDKLFYAMVGVRVAIGKSSSVTAR